MYVSKLYFESLRIIAKLTLETFTCKTDTRGVGRAPEIGVFEQVGSETMSEYETCSFFEQMRLNYLLCCNRQLITGKNL